MGRCITVLAVAALLLAAPAAHANNWDEAINGDLSGDRLAPSTLALTPGSNLVIDTTIAGDLDYLTVTVPTGYVLSAIDLLNFVSTDDLGFLAIQAGSTFTEPPTGTNVANLLGWAHTGPFYPQPYLEILGTSDGAIGFTGALPSGLYTLWIQQTGAQLIGTTFDLVVTAPVPEPAAGVLALLGISALLGRVANRFLGRAE